MNNITILFNGNREPAQANANDAGYDLTAGEWAEVAPRSRRLINTRLRVAIPAGHVGMVCSRSGLALKRGVIVLNAPGIIDAGYTGEIGVLLYNTGDEYFDVKEGDRIAQLIIKKIEHPTWVRSALVETARGDGGFGSTGV